MRCESVLRTTVPSDIKVQAKAIADREFLSEAAWLKRLVVREIRAARGADPREREPCRADVIRAPNSRSGSGRPLFVRLRNEDRLLLDARAEARMMRPATYASVLIRAHLRNLAPLPKDELLALKRSIAELASIGRNINQIAKALNEGANAPVSVREEFRAMLKVCEALRDNTKALLKANVTSWESGFAEDI
ncbi:plasmid mobilization relaxosome protein MobC [Povalibacter sp.]|uniref:plasmid mobilization relaxosome protein MobC n=1 Tax=Povalibacter sp. TaxID=1962978 RepID=UPI002F3F0F91